MATEAAVVDAGTPDEPITVVLFYKYVLLGGASAAAITAQVALCGQLGLNGRVLVSVEGINGTLSSNRPNAVEEYMAAMDADPAFGGDIDWKTSSSAVQPFPDLIVKRVTNLVAGSAGSLENGGVHLSPTEFHHALAADDVVLLDVRNTFEHAIGRFETAAGQPATEPGMKSFAGFAGFCDRIADTCKDKKVLMYCTGGIRCEKASAMLRDRGVDDVSQLQGGIHRYLEAFPDGGLFKGKNFVFDKRRALGPADAAAATVTGKCAYCTAAYDELSGARICTVCRDLVLVCEPCRAGTAELHCDEHRYLKHCYFTFLDHFDQAELVLQADGLRAVLAGIGPGGSRNKRRTMTKQKARVESRLQALVTGACTPQPRVARCRTCELPSTKCNGLCWGFWKESNGGDAAITVEPTEAAVSVAPGDVVRRGPGWGARYGQQDGGAGGAGEVLQVKGWGDANATDAVTVRWRQTGAENVYRWGVVLADGSRVYDVEHKHEAAAGSGGGKVPA